MNYLIKFSLALTFLILTSAGFAFAQTESKCFQADSLRGGHIVTFKTNGNKISGTFTVASNDNETVKTYEFTGTRTGNILKVKFDENELPDLTPSSKLKSLNWTLVKIAGKEILRIKIYGKNYETNEYADYFADFEPCEPGYDALLKTAEIIGPISIKSFLVAPLALYTERLSFKDTRERKVFLIKLPRNAQMLEIKAANCKISVYLPSGKLYEFVEWKSGGERTFASSTIDQMTIKPIPQSGSYLVVVQKMAEDARPDSVTFKIMGKRRHK